MTIEDQKKIAAKRIRDLRNSLNMNQAEFADFIGVEGENGQSTVSKWESAKQLPGSQYTAKMAAKTSQDPVYFSGLDAIDSTNRLRPRMCRLMGELQAGAWREAIQFDYDDQRDVEFPAMIQIPPYAMEAYIVRGDSMNDFYPDGSIVYVAGVLANALSPLDGDHVLVQRMDNNGLFEATLKELVIMEDGSKWLWPRSSNPEFQLPLKVNGHDAREYDVQITGVVQCAFVTPRRRGARRG